MFGDVYHAFYPTKLVQINIKIGANLQSFNRNSYINQVSELVRGSAVFCQLSHPP